MKARPFTYADGKLTYAALNGEAYEYWSHSTKLPAINGRQLEVNPALTYDFPYLKMKHDEDTVTISYQGYEDLGLKIKPVTTPRKK